MKKRDTSINGTKFVNAMQVGGIESYSIDDGEGRGVRVLCFNTGGGLRFRVLADRGLDIDQAFLHQHSLAFLTHKGVTPPTRALDRGVDWLKSFPGGLLTSCGPFNVGPPVVEGPWELGLHGSHSNTAATIESIVQPDPHRGQNAMSVTGVVRYGQLFGPNLRLRRTITCTLGGNAIDVADEFLNDANTACEHAWLLHINFGYPLVDDGTELCYERVIEPRGDAASEHFFATGNPRIITSPRKDHAGGNEAAAYVKPGVTRGVATVGLVNRELSIGVAVQYDPKQFPRCANWQHLGAGEYVTALEPMTGTVSGRDKDRASGDLVVIPAGGKKSYRYRIHALAGEVQLKPLLALNTEARRSSSAAARSRRR